MLSLAQTPGDDNKIIWLIELELSTGVQRFCSGVGRNYVALSGKDYRNALQKNSLAFHGQSIPADEMGGIGSRFGFTFTLVNYGAYTIDSFMPAAAAPEIYLAPCRLGFIWEGATTQAEITWLCDAFVENYQFDSAGFAIEAVERNLDFDFLPVWKIQKETDDKHTYFPRAPKESIGKFLPIVYGGFDRYIPEQGKYRLTPAILVDMQRLIFIGAGHECKQTFYDHDGKHRVFRQIDGKENYLEIAPVAGDTVNNVNGTTVRLLTTAPRAGSWVDGFVYIRKLIPGAFTDVTDLSLFQEENYSTSLTLVHSKKLGFQFDSGITHDFGSPNIGLTDIELVVLWKTSAPGETRALKIEFYNENKAGGAGYTGATGYDTQGDFGTYKFTRYQFGNVVDGKSNSNLPWDWGELLGLQWVLTNVSGDSHDPGDILIREIYLQLNYIVLWKLTPQRFPRTTTGGSRH